MVSSPQKKDDAITQSTITNRPDIPWIDSALVDWFVPPEMQDDSSYEAYQYRAVVLCTLGLTFWAVPFALVLAAMAIPELAAVSAAGLVTVAVLKIVSMTGGKYWPGQVTCSFTIVLVGAGAWLDGGISSPAVYWLVVAPVVAGMFQDETRWTVIWTVVAIAAALGLYLVGQLGVQPATVLDAPWKRRVLEVGSPAALFVGLVLVFVLQRRLQGWLVETIRRKEDEQRDVDQQVRQMTRETLWTMLDASPVGIVVENQQQRIMYANGAFQSLAGYEDFELEGMPTDNLLRETGCEAVLDDISSSAQQDPLFVGERDVVGKDGELHPVEIHAFWAEIEDEPVIVSIVRDLSQRRELQTKMMQMDRLIAVGNLAAGVAHEVNNPLTFIQSNVEFLLEEIPDDPGDDQRYVVDVSTREIRRALRDILEGSGRIRDIVDDLRTFSVDTNTVLEPVDVEAIIESAINMASNQLDQRAELVRDYEDLPPVFADESTLAQVVMNLLVNAAQAIPEGAVGDHQIRVSTRSEADEIAIEVSDTGQGIPEEMIDSIFDPFVTTKSESDGMGMGLAISQSKIQNLDGRIDVESTVGEGSTFRVSIPRRDVDDQPRQHGEATTEQPAPGQMIVIIDDEPRVLRGQRRQFGRDLEVETYQSAREALEEMNPGGRPDLILCDLQMPRMSGREWFRRLGRDFGPAWQQRVVFMTGGAFTPEAREFIEETDRPVLDKPLAAREVLKYLERVDVANEDRRGVDGAG